MTTPAIAVSVTETPAETPAERSATASSEQMTPSSAVAPLVEQAGKVAALEATVAHLESQLAATADHATRAELEAQVAMVLQRLDALTPPPAPEEPAVEVLTVEEPPTPEPELPPPVVRKKHPLDFLF
jgi:hypothetical protein